jgi:hypothetical protein
MTMDEEYHDNETSMIPLAIISFTCSFMVHFFAAKYRYGELESFLIRGHYVVLNQASLPEETVRLRVSGKAVLDLLPNDIAYRLFFPLRLIEEYSSS